MQYRKRRYLEFLPIVELNERIFDVVNNIRIRTEQGKIGLLPIDNGAEFWMIKFTHLMEECALRDYDYPGPVNISMYAEELKSATDPVPDVPAAIERRHLGPRDLLLRFAQRSHNREALENGKILVNSASSLGKQGLDRARRDHELARTIRHLPDEVKIVRPDGSLADPVGYVDFTRRTRTDYHVYCLSASFSSRLLADFRSDSCLLIFRPDAFLQRLLQAFEQAKSDWSARMGLVQYFDPLNHTGEPPDTYFSKHFRFAYQHEFRVVWLPPGIELELKPFFLSLGPLHDCAELIG